MLLIPLGIILAFSAKGLSLYLAKSIMISVGEDVRKAIQVDMMKNLIIAEATNVFPVPVAISSKNLVCLFEAASLIAKIDLC